MANGSGSVRAQRSKKVAADRRAGGHDRRRDRRLRRDVGAG